jgi:hypothetical protein
MAYQIDLQDEDEFFHSATKILSSVFLSELDFSCSVTKTWRFLAAWRIVQQGNRMEQDSSTHNAKLVPNSQNHMGGNPRDINEEKLTLRSERSVSHVVLREEEKSGILTPFAFKKL